MRSQQNSVLGRLSAQPDAEDDPDDPDGPGPSVPSWVPDGTPRGRDWLAAVRADPGRTGGLALAAIAVLAVLIAVFTMLRSHPPPVTAAKLPPVQPMSATTLATSVSPPPEQPVVVSVVGLVNEPGLVTVAPQSRVADAVKAAGGPLTGADTLGLNLARRVTDGEQIVVGIATPAGHRPALGSSTGGEPAAPAPPAGPLDLNSATVEQLDALPGVGPVRAAAIVAWRQTNGRFASIDQLGEVDGIGPARLAKLRPLVRV